MQSNQFDQHRELQNAVFIYCKQSNGQKQEFLVSLRLQKLS